MVGPKEKVKEILEKKESDEKGIESAEERREIHPLDSTVIFREEILGQLNRIATAIELLATQNEKPIEQENSD